MLRPFEEDAACGKCGSKDIATHHVPDGKPEAWCCCQEPALREEREVGMRWEVTAEHLERRCRRCGYTWPEAVVEREAVSG